MDGDYPYTGFTLTDFNYSLVDLSQPHLTPSPAATAERLDDDGSENGSVG